MASEHPPQLNDSDSKAPSFRASPALPLLALLSLAACLFFIGLGRLPLLEPDEGRNAEVAREMLVSGDWVTPHFNSLPYLDKPAVFFWLVAASFKMAGISEWAARLPSALMALATALLVWSLGRRMFGDTAGLRAGAVFATSPLVIILARMVIFDAAFTFLVTLALAAYWFGEEAGHRDAWPSLIMFAAMGAATITKGPVGFLLPLLTILAYHAARRNFGGLGRLHWGLGLAVFLAVTLPWFIAVSVRYPDFPRYALWEESLLRFATGRMRRQGNLFYYIPVFLLGFFPWSFCLIYAGWKRLPRWRELKEEIHKPVLFSLAWAGVVFAFFSISQSKLPNYFLPAVIPLSLMMGQVWGEVGSERASRSPDWLTAGFATLLGLGLVIATASRWFLFGALEARLEKRLPPASLAMVRPTLLYTGLILIALAIIGRNLAARAVGRVLSTATFILLALTTPLLIIRWVTPLEAYAASVSSRRLAKTIMASDEKDLPVYGYYYFRNSLPFYLRRPVGLVTADGGELTSTYVSVRWRQSGLRGLKVGGPIPPGETSSQSRAAASPQAAPLLTDARGLVEGSLPRPALFLVRNTHVSKLAQAAGRIDPLWTEWDYSVWKVPAGEH